MNADGSGQRNLTKSEALDSSPAWSPDGKRILFVVEPSDADDFNFEVFSMNADGSRPTNLTKSPAFDGTPSWRP